MNHSFVPYNLNRKKLGIGFYEADFTIFIPELAIMDQPIENLLTDFEEPEYKFVGFWPRFGAILIDGIILLVVSYLISLFLSNPDGIAFILVTTFIPLLYHPVLEYRYGATIGKMAVGIKIVNYNFKKLTLSNAILRNSIYIGIQLINFFIESYRVVNPEESINPFQSFISNEESFSIYAKLVLIYFICIILIYVIELIFLLTDEKYRALHDRIGKTYVVRKTG